MAESGDRLSPSMRWLSRAKSFTKIDRKRITLAEDDLKTDSDFSE